jgi:two-component system, OmpR family, response regulator CpxR
MKVHRLRPFGNPATPVACSWSSKPGSDRCKIPAACCHPVKEDDNSKWQPYILPCVTATVLIVDDGADARESLAAVLGHHGYAVICASDGREAVELLDRVTPDVVLLDVRMPRMDGRQFLAWFQQQDRLAKIPVIVMSGTDSVPEAKVFLAKPANPLAVLAAVVAAVSPFASKSAMT